MMLLTRTHSVSSKTQAAPWHRLKTLVCALVLCWLSCLPAYAALRLGAPFGEHMVLPRDTPVSIWGTGAPGGETVRVSIQGQTAVGHSDWQGRWMVTLRPMKAGGPFQMNVEVGGLGPMIPSSAANGTGGAELNDVLIGDVVPASALPSAAASSIASTQPHPFALVRVYRAATNTESAHWVLVRQDTVPLGAENLFATGRTLYAARHVPVGILETTTVAHCPPSTSCSSH